MVSFQSAKKNILFAKDLNWCARVLDRPEHQVDSTNIEGLRNMELPHTAAELVQFVYCCRWMAISIPEFLKKVAMLVDVLEEAYARTVKRAAKSIR